MVRNYTHMIVGQIPEHFGNRATTKNKIAVQCDDGFKISWAELNMRSNQVTRLLESKGIARGDKVATFIKNCGQFIEIVYACAKLGAGVVPINFRFIDKEVKYALENSDTKAIFVHKSLLDVLTSALEGNNDFDNRNIIVLDEDDASGYDALLSSFSADDFELNADENDLFWMSFTGGTTGYPKACQVTNRIKMTFFTLMALEFGNTSKDKMLISGALNYGLSFMHSLQQLYLGGSIYIMRNFEEKQLLTLIQKEKITTLPMVPTMFSTVINYPDKAKYDISSVSILICTGAPLPIDLKKQIVAFFHNAVLTEFYGTTECGMFTTLKIKKGDSFEKAASIGLPGFCSEICLMDENGNPVKQGEIGEFYKRGPLLSTGYYKNSEETAKMFRGEWAGVGDLGYQDEDGYYYMVGRSKDMIISGGVNVYPAEIENAIMNIRGVNQVAVIGIPDEKWGEVAMAFISLNKGAQVSDEVVLKACSENLSRYKMPRKIKFVEDLPKSTAGKILKREFKEAFLKKGEDSQ